MVNPTSNWDAVPVFGFYFLDDLTPASGNVKLTVTQRVTRVDGRRIYPEGATITRTIGDTSTNAAVRDAVRDAWRAADQAAQGASFDATAWNAWWNVMLTGAVFASFPANDDPDIVQTGYQVKVEEQLFSGGGREFYIEPTLAALSSVPPGINLGMVDVPEGAPLAPAPIYAKGLPGGVAALDAQGFVLDAAGNRVTGGGAVASVAGKTGVVTLVKGDVGLANVDNTADSAKPVSTEQATAIAAKADTSALTAHTGNTANPHAVTKAQVGLGNVDNTSDANKPVSTAQAAADTAAIAAAATDATSRVATETTRATAAELALRNLSDSAFSTALGARIATVVASNQPPIQVIIPGVAAVATNVVPPGIRMVGATTLDSVILRAGTVPTGASLVLMIRKNGATVQSVSLPAGQSSVTVTGLAAGVVAGDVLTFDITGVGSTVAGADLALDIIPNPAAVADTPLGLSGIAGRWRADSLTGLVADGALVSAWADKSGLNRNLASTGIRQPTMVANAINGQPAVRFTNTGSAKYMTASGFTVPQPFTQVIIAKTADVSVDSCLIGSFSGGQADTKIAFTRATLNAPTTAASNPVLVNNTWYGIYGGFSGAASIQRVYPLSSQVTLSPGTNGMNGVTLGNNAFQSSVEGDFHIAEAFIFDHILTTTEQTTMNTYINTRYGI